MMAEPITTPANKPTTHTPSSVLRRIVTSWVKNSNEDLRAAMEAEPNGSVLCELESQWGIVVGDRKCGWSMLDCICLDGIHPDLRAGLLSEIVARTGASALVYLFDGQGVWPTTNTGWRQLAEWRDEHDGSIDSHPSSTRGVISLMWTPTEIINLSIPFRDGKPGRKIRRIVSAGATVYNEILATQELDPVGSA